MFVNRESEIEALERRYRGRGAEFVVVYGRRRVGKTLLLSHFAATRPHLYFLADLRPEADQIRHFAERLAAVVPDPLLRGGSFTSWDPLFEVIARVAERERFVLVIDEYPYLRQVNGAIGSMIQRLWDEHWRNTQLFLVLCGSYISAMENEVLGHTSPLYGRRTGQILVEPFSFSAARQLLPHRDARAQVETYAIAGGVPAYLQPLAGAAPLWEQVRDVALYKDGFLYDEVRFLLMEELREPRNYFAILAAIAHGRHRLNEIVQGSGLSREVVSRYLDILRDLRLVRRDVPVTETQAHKSRKGLYRIDDPFFRFWFRFVYPNTDDLESEDAEFVLRERIQPHFADYVAYTFEEVCRQAVTRLSRSGVLPFRCRRVGSWWDSQTEIDVVGLGDDPNDLLVGECKWSDRAVGTNVLDDLKRKTEALLKVHSAGPVHYALFSRAGFTPGLQALAQHEALSLFTLDEIAAA